MDKALAQFPPTFFDRALGYLKESKSFNVGDFFKILRSAKESDFSDRSHYVYYKRYVIPKLSRVGKRYKVGEECSYWENRKIVKEMWFDLNVKVSESYLLLEFVVNRSHEDFLSWYRYLLGKDRGKVFVNRIRQSWREGNGGLMRYVRCGESDVSVYVVEDSEIKHSLGYSEDSEYELAIVADEGNFRVQGEVVLRASRTSLEKFLEVMADQLKREAIRYATYLFADYLMQVLIDMGFSPRVERFARWGLTRGHIVIDGALDRKRAGVEALALAHGLARELRRRDIGEVEFNAVSREIWVESEYYGEHRLRVRDGRGRYGEKYVSAIIEVEAHRGGKLYEELCEDIDRHVRALERQNYDYVIGNHFISLKNVLSSTVAYVPCIRPRVLEERVFSVESGHFYVDEKSEVVMAHREHGEAEVKFLRPLTIEVVTTLVDEDYPRELNRVALGLLKDEEFEKLAKGLTGEERAWEW